MTLKKEEWLPKLLLNLQTRVLVDEACEVLLCHARTVMHVALRSLSPHPDREIPVWPTARPLHRATEQRTWVLTRWRVAVVNERGRLRPHDARKLAQIHAHDRLIKVNHRVKAVDKGD